MKREPRLSQEAATFHIRRYWQHRDGSPITEDEASTEAMYWLLDCEYEPRRACHAPERRKRPIKPTPSRLNHRLSLDIKLTRRTTDAKPVRLHGPDGTPVDRTIHNASKPPTLSPTKRAYDYLQAAYAHFNATLFGSQLPDCLITLQRKANVYGYFQGRKFREHKGQATTDEIALNPAHFEERSAKEILSTLVHEMAHVWQQHHGNPGRRGYHNPEWAAKMNQIGLIPSHTGQPGGKQTGQKVSHWINAGGPFTIACAAFMAEHGTTIYSDQPEGTEARKKKAASKTKYTCPGCGLHAWAKPNAPLACAECTQLMEAEDAQGDDAQAAEDAE
jgi:hypothetical protein